MTGIELFGLLLSFISLWWAVYRQHCRIADLERQVRSLLPLSSVSRKTPTRDPEECY